MSPPKSRPFSRAVREEEKYSRVRVILEITSRGRRRGIPRVIEPPFFRFHPNPASSRVVRPARSAGMVERIESGVDGGSSVPLCHAELPRKCFPRDQHFCPSSFPVVRNPSFRASARGNPPSREVARGSRSTVADSRRVFVVRPPARPPPSPVPRERERGALALPPPVARGNLRQSRQGRNSIRAGEKRRAAATRSSAATARQGGDEAGERERESSTEDQRVASGTRRYSGDIPAILRRADAPDARIIKSAYFFSTRERAPSTPMQTAWGVLKYRDEGWGGEGRGAG